MQAQLIKVGNEYVQMHGERVIRRVRVVGLYGARRDEVEVEGLNGSMRGTRYSIDADTLITEQELAAIRADRQAEALAASPSEGGHDSGDDTSGH